MRPPTIAPEMEVRPPRISTGSALRAMRESENCTPLFAPHMIPATRATPPDTDHTMTQMVLRGMPTERAAWWSSATARRARPMVVLVKKIASPNTRTAPTTAAMTSNPLRRIPWYSMTSLGIPMSRRLTLLPHRVSPNPSRKNVSPIVDMKRMNGSWFTRGRSITRSMTRARTTMMARVRITASQAGTPSSISPTSERAANSTITPWAKLKISDALKMSTKPRATREYITPVSRPFTTTSVKKTGASHISTKGVTRIAVRISMRAPVQPAGRRFLRSSPRHRPLVIAPRSFRVIGWPSGLASAEAGGPAARRTPNRPVRTHRSSSWATPR